MKDSKKPLKGKKEDAFWESRENLCAVLESSPLAMVVMDARTIVRMWNPAAERMFGWKAKEILGKPYPLIPPEEETSFRKQLRDGCGGATFTNLRARRIRKDGTILDASISSTLLKNAKGDVIGFLGLLEDITERLRVEKKLSAAHEMQNAMIQASPLAIIVLDTQTRVTLWNPAAERMFGWKEKEIIGKPAPNVPDEEKHIFAAHIKQLMDGQPFREIEIRPRRKDGSVFDAQISSAILRDAGGGITGFLGIFEDITVKKSSLEILRMSEEKYRLLVETMSDGLGILDEKGLITYVNDELCAMFGRRRNEIVGKNPSEFLDEASRKIFREQLSKRRKGESSTYELTWKQKNGGKVITIVSAKALMDASGCFKGAFAVITDITKQKHSENALRESTEKLSLLADEQKMLLANTRDFVYRHDTKGVFNYMSPSVEAITGYTVNEWYKHYTTYLTDHPCNEDVIKYTEATLKTGKESPPYLVEIYHKKGHRVTLEVNERPYFENKKVAGIIGIARDVSERHKMSEALKASEEQWRALITNSPDIIMTVDTQGTILFINRAAGEFELEKVIGSSMYDYVSKEHHAMIKESIRRVVKTGKQITYEIPGPGANGAEAWYRTRMGPLKKRGKVSALLLIVTDITERKNAEDALRQSEERYRSLVATAQDVIFTLSGEGVLTSLNPSFETMTGWTCDEWIGRHFSELVHPDDMPYAAELFQRGQKGELFPVFELRVLSKSGEFIFAEFKASPIFVNGRIEGAFGIARDIRERKKAEEALHKAHESLEQRVEERTVELSMANAVLKKQMADIQQAKKILQESEQKYRLLVENLSEIVYVVELYESPMSGKVTYASKQTENIIGYSPEEFINDGGLWFSLLHPEDIPSVQKSTAEIVEGKKVGLREYRLRHKKTEEYRWLADRVVPRVDENGNVTGFFGVARDVTARKLMEEQLRKSEAHLRAVIEAEPACVKVVDAEGKLISMNKAGLSMIEAERMEDVSGKCIYDVVAPAYRDVFREATERACRGEAGFLEFELIGAKGTRRWMESHVVPLSYGESSKKVALGITNDITQRKRTMEALRESEARYRALSENTPQGIWQISPEGYTLYVNPAMCEILEINEQDALEGKTYHEFFTPESLEKIKTEGLKREKGISSAYEVELIGKRGGKRNIMLSGAPLFDADGKLHSRIGTFTDITVRKKYEEDLKTTLSLLSATLESTADGILVVDTEGKIASFNHRFVEMWNIPAQIIAARDDNKAIGFVLKQLREPKKFVKKIRELYATPEAESYDLLEFKDGRVFERYSVPQRLGENIAGRVWSFRDVSERRRAEKLLQRRLDFENLIAVLSTSFINLSPDEVDSGVDFALRAIAEFTGADRSFVFQYSNGGGFMSNTHEWCAEDVEPQFHRMQNVDGGKVLPWFERKIREQDFLHVPSVDDLPEEAAAEKKYFQEQRGAQSFVVVPMICGGSIFGLVGFDSIRGKKVWPDEVVSLLKIVGDIFVNALERQKNSDLLKQNEEQYRLLFETHPHPMWIYDIETLSFLAVNEAAIKHYGYAREEFLSMTMKDIRPSEDIPIFLEHLAEDRFPDIDFEGTRRHLKKDGALIHVEITSREITFAGRRAKVVMTTDVTERKRSQEALRGSEARLRMLTEKMPAILWSTDSELVFTSSLGAGLGNLQMLPNEAVGMTLFEYFQTEDPNFAAIDAHRRALEEGESVTYEMHWAGRTYSSHVEPLRDGSGNIIGCVGAALDITEQKQAEETVQHQAYHDALTGLPNRLLFNDRLAIEISHAHRKNEKLAVLFLDLDRFKTINDTLGHAVGDQLLQGAAGRLISHLSDDSTIARLGGDEFMILLADVKSVEDVTRAAKKVLEAFKQPWIINTHELHITTSIGVALYPDDGEDVETLVRNADTAMYRAKQQGRNNYQLYAPAMNVKAFEQLVMENSLRRALDRKEFIIHYQPQVNALTGQITGVEALLRWQHPDLGLIFPSNFIPLAEETGLIVPIGEWVLRTACAQNKMWQKAGVPPLRVSVNLASRQFQQKDLVEMVSHALGETGLEPQYLDLEITESIVMEDADATLLVLRELTKKGIQISIDDFGTGYSSLSYLKMFPLHTLKIDQSFVRDSTADPNDAAIASAIIVLGHSLKLRVIAEGVETQDQFLFLKQQKCDEIQGFLFGRPVSAEEIQPVLMQKFIRVR